MKKNTVYVDSDGCAYAMDDHLREIAEAQVHYVPEADVWMPKPIRGATVRSPLVVVPVTTRRYRGLRYS